MNLWAVMAVGEGFAHLEGTASFELYGVVSAADAHAALDKAIDLAVQRWPEIAQGREGAGAMIHAEEVNEITMTPGMEVDVVDVSWV
ncbi:hypothetical protein [Dyella jiangningensis]|uniref:Uncharacterized protein n=1 Tax=Dyella jiangningensis TaxID=1379159 RepID=A0A328P2N0_9GAMM|nr:hypothetical protein [Dyella jiangningensis]RAO74424.1 hypothetical protein CA260_20300 [Dyella jiangningensis]